MKITERGSIMQITNLIVGKDDTYRMYLQIPDYKGVSWKCNVTINKHSPTLSAWTFISQDSPVETLTLGIHRETISDEVLLHVYSPFWMINRTGLDLLYKGEGRDNVVINHPRTIDGPVMFSFPGKAFFSNKAANVKVHDSKIRNVTSSTDWSEKFSLETAGSCGSVTCKSPLQSFQIGVEIQLSTWGLTRYVIFTPRFYLSNQCPFTIYAIEMENLDDEIEVPSGKCIPFWPKSHTPHMKVAVRILKRRDETQPFRYDIVEHTVLKLSNEVRRIKLLQKMNLETTIKMS